MSKQKQLIMHVDFPTQITFEEEVEVIGWTASQSQVAKILFEGSEIDNFESSQRIDVEKKHPNYKYIKGFSFKAKGKHLFGKDSITVTAMCLDGTESKFSRVLEKSIQYDIKRKKLERIRDHLRADLPFKELPTRFDFMTDSLREEASIVESSSISSHSYTPEIHEEIDKTGKDGLVLDCGAGYRDTNEPRIINFEIEPYSCTDVRGIAENLPFKDNTFDLILSLAVLEHVKTPLLAVKEMERVLKPGGKIWVDVAFMQPFHGYPNHFFNMTSEGLKSLFSPNIKIEWEKVPEYGTPIWCLSWFLNVYLNALPENQRKAFSELKVSDLTKPGDYYGNEDWVTKLSAEGQTTLAATNSILVKKR